MASQENDADINCDFCRKSYDKSRLLKHIAQSKECKSYYGPRFTEMKKESKRKRVNKHRSKVITIKEKNKQLKRRREFYAKK